MRTHRRRGRALRLAGQRRQAAAHARGQHADPAGARQRHRDAVRRMHAVRVEGPAHHRGRGARRRCSSACAGRCAAAPSMSSGSATPTRCSASCRAACSRACARSRRRRWPNSTSPGYAVGGVSVGEPKEEMRRIVAHTPRLPAGGQAALPDGRRHARGPGRRRRRRRRHVRLRDADPQRPQRPPVHPLRRPAHPQRAPSRGRSGRSTRAAPATPAAASLAPTCTTSTAAARCSARCSARSTTCTTTST